MMAETDAFLRFMAAWALIHESADEGWRSAVRRGAALQPGEMDAGPEAFVDGLSAIIAEEKERLKAELSSGQVQTPGSTADVLEHLEGIRFEIAELRGRVESLQASLDAIGSPGDSD